MSVFLVMGFGTLSSVQAAEMTLQPVQASDGSSLTFLDVSGDVVLGDAAKFKAVAASAPAGTIVSLTSNGGSLEEGIEIGREIRRRQFMSSVLGTCASACALAWLGGTKLVANEEARIGFHAAYRNDGTMSESGMANALVGLYAGELGYGANVVKYITNAPPQGMEWLTARDATLLGIDVVVIKSDDQQAIQDTPKKPTPEDIERQALDFVLALIKAHADSDNQALQIVGAHYAPIVEYFGKTKTMSEVLVDKQAYFKRWPVRGQAVDTNTVRARCYQSICSVDGVYQWFVANPAKSKSISGTASFAFGLEMGQTITVRSESGVVLSKNK